MIPLFTRFPILLVIGGKGKKFVNIQHNLFENYTINTTPYCICQVPQSIIYNTIHINIIKQPIRLFWMWNPYIFFINSFLSFSFCFLFYFTHFADDLLSHFLLLKNNHSFSRFHSIIRMILQQTIKFFLQSLLNHSRRLCVCCSKFFLDLLSSLTVVGELPGSSCNSRCAEDIKSSMIKILNMLQHSMIFTFKLCSTLGTLMWFA